MVQILKDKDVWAIEKYALGWKQLRSIIESTHRINIWEGAVRSGKTHGSIKRWIEYIGTAPEQGDLLMIGKTYGSLVRNVIRPMKEFIGDDMVFYSSKNIIRLWGEDDLLLWGFKHRFNRSNPRHDVLRVLWG